MRAEFEIPGSFPSVANLREHWAARQRRTRRQRTTAGVMTAIAVPEVKPLVQAHGGTVTLTRHAPRKLDTDNLASALKATRDGIAAALGVDDGDPRVTWAYGQERCKGGQQRVVVVVQAAAPLAYRPPVVFSTSGPDPLEAERIVTETKL